MQSTTRARYFENTLADSITNRKPFRSGLSIHDIHAPAEPRRSRSCKTPGLRYQSPQRWTGGRYAYVAALRWFTDCILCIVDQKPDGIPEMVSKWWLPGEPRGGETNPAPRGNAMHCIMLIVAGNRGYSAWRDGGFIRHFGCGNRSCSHINWSPPPAGTRHRRPPNAAGGGPRCINAEFCEKGIFYLMQDVGWTRCQVHQSPDANDRTIAEMGNFYPHNLQRIVPGTFQSEPIFSTITMRARVGHQGSVPAERNRLLVRPRPRLVDPRANVARCAC
jgi:hypothetical protein